MTHSGPDSALDAAIAQLGNDLVEAGRSRRFRFHPDAAAELENIQTFKKRELKRIGSSGPFSNFIDKLPKAFARIALVFHFIEWYSDDLFDLDGGDPPILISTSTARRARLFITEFVFRHAANFYSSFVNSGETESDAKWIAGHILAHKLTSIKHRDIWRAYRRLRGAQKQTQRANALYELEMEGWVKPIGPQLNGIPKAWVINPLVHDGRFDETAQREAARRAEIRDAIDKSAEQRKFQKANLRNGDRLEAGSL